MRLGASYIVPIRWTSPGPIGELAVYLGEVSSWVEEVIVVDDSPPAIYAAHRERLPAGVLQIPVDPDRHSPNGKVDGVLTGIAAAAHERIVIADDDVRWERGTLAVALRRLAGAELVRPQNYFHPLCWHARWDSARSLLNRVVTGDREFPVGDFPGTLALRRSAVLAIGGYDGRALFENLELMREVAAAGGRVVTPLDLYVPRRPPTFAHFRSQRLRQAYDDWAMPARLGAFLAVIPVLLGLLARGRRRAAAALAVAPAIIAEAGRRRAGGARHFPPSCSLLAPLWVGERAVYSWIALWHGLRGSGVRYSRDRITHAATPGSRLRADPTGTPDRGLFVPEAAA
ncbi:MAG TPA: glycosyltransferase [Solirubrobacterales bacterium]|nr:glycosyltransferase [Solirubrobacterales bacterium]